MKDFSKYALVAIIAYAVGVWSECSQLANDEEYHDYWMKRYKKKSE